MILSKLKAVLRHRGFKIFNRPYELNIVGLRSGSVIPNRFDDEIHVFYKTGALNWNYHVFKATTDPGTFWLNNPMNDQGTAILAQGQFTGAYQIGLHQGKYKALVQRKPVDIIRDYNRDAVLDFLNGRKVRELAGINIHRASLNGTTKYVDKYSAGCQVFENVHDFDKFLMLCDNHRKRYGNSFTYSLIDFRAVRRENLRRLAVGSGVVGMFALGYLLLSDKPKIKSIMEQISEAFMELFNNKNSQTNERNFSPDTP